MKLDYSIKYTDKKRHAIIRGVTANGDFVFVRRELPNGQPLTWKEYAEGKGYYARWQPYFGAIFEYKGKY